MCHCETELHQRIGAGCSTCPTACFGLDDGALTGTEHLGQKVRSGEWELLTLPELSLLAASLPPSAAGLATLSRSLLVELVPPCSEDDWSVQEGGGQSLCSAGWDWSFLLVLYKFFLSLTVPVNPHGSCPGRAENHQGVDTSCCWLSWTGSLLTFHFVADLLVPQTWCGVIACGITEIIYMEIVSSLASLCLEPYN